MDLLIVPSIAHRWCRRSVIALLSMVWLLGSLQAQSPAVGDEPRSAVPESVDAKLRRIEQNVLIPALVDGAARHASILEYFCDANRELTKRLEFAKGALIDESAEKRPLRQMSVVAGPAGIGKTFLKRHAYQGIPAEQVWRTDVREIFEQFASDGLSRPRPDLHHGDRVFNRLLALTPSGRKAFVDLLDSKREPCFIIDSLDEVHPDDYLFVMEQLERTALDAGRESMHLIVFGRPLAFQPYWQDRAGDGLRPEVRGFLLHGPDFQTLGDLRVSDWNFDCWRYSLKRGDGEMSLVDYRRWCDRDFSISGEFSDIRFEPNQHMTAEARRELRAWASESRVVATALSNLAGNGMVRKIVVDHIRSDQEFDETRFMNNFFQLWLERDTQSDDRPSRIKPQHLSLYIQLMKDIATKYAVETDERGYFDVSDDDRVLANVGGESISVPVKRILNRSGLINVDPLDPVAGRFRFEPFWFHRALVQTNIDQAE